MSNQQGLHVDQSGSISKPKTQSTKVINAWSQARDSFTRTVIGGVVLGVLSIAYVVALFMKIDDAHNILVIVGSSLGFLLGGRDKTPANE